MIFRPFRFLPLLVACSVLTLAAPLRAADLKYPETGPSITMTVPDAWTVTKKNGNVLLTAPGGKVSITLSKSMADGPETPAEGAKEFSTGAGMKDVEVKEVPDTEEGGSKASIALAMGKLKEQDYVTTVMKLTTAEGAKLVIIAFGEKAAVLDNKEVDGIMNSIK